MFHVVETACYPAKWKVENKQWPNSNNATCNYFRDYEVAIREANRRNKQLQIAKNYLRIEISF